MAISSVCHRSATSLRAIYVLFVFAVLVVHVGGRHHVCPPFSCGGFRNVSYPFRRQGDPHGCGAQSYELVCTDTSATIRIGRGTYNVLSINYTDPIFWVVDANLGMQSSCPLPRWDQGDAAYAYALRGQGKSVTIEFATAWGGWAIFLNCSRELKNNGLRPVRCLSTMDSFIYVSTKNWYSVEAYDFEPSCGYLAVTPLGGPGMVMPENASYPDVVKFMREGFALQFPITWGEGVRKCLSSQMR